MEGLKAAYEDWRRVRRESNEELRVALLDACPVGGAVRWKKGGHAQEGVVLRHYREDMMEVRNTRTGRDVQICAYDVLNAYQSQVA